MVGVLLMLVEKGQMLLCSQLLQEARVGSIWAGSCCSIPGSSCSWREGPMGCTTCLHGASWARGGKHPSGLQGRRRGGKGEGREELAEVKAETQRVKRAVKGASHPGRGRRRMKVHRRSDAELWVLGDPHRAGPPFAPLLS